jgi:hypothetical protein
MSVDQENLMAVYRSLVPDDDEFVNSVVMEYLLLELPSSKIMDDSDKYLRSHGIEVSLPEEDLSKNSNLHTATSPTDSLAVSPLPASSMANSPVNSANIPFVAIKSSVVKSEPKRSSRGNESEKPSFELRASKRKRVENEDAIEIFARVVDALIKQPVSPPLPANLVSSSPLPLKQASPKPTPSAVSNLADAETGKSNSFICKTCGEHTSDRVCVWNRVGILPGPYTASALKYLNSINIDFTPESLFSQQNAMLLEVKFEEIEIPSLAHMKNLEANLTVALASRLKLVRQQQLDGKF